MYYIFIYICTNIRILSRLLTCKILYMNLKKLILILCIFSTSIAFSQNNALYFDGTNDYVNLNIVSDSMANISTFTIEFWMKADLNSQANSSYPSTALFAINTSTVTSSGSNRLLIMMGDPYSVQDGKLWIGNNIGTPFQDTTIIGDNNCHHIAYSQNGNTGSIYVDGIFKGTFVDSVVLSSTDLYSIGQEWDGSSPSQYYNGEIDGLRIWKTTRTMSEIQANMYAQLSGNVPGLVASYNFNQGIANGNNSGINLLNDNSSNALNGTLNNFSLNGGVSNWITASCTRETSSTNSLNFDGVNDYVNLNVLAAPMANLSSFTIEFIMRADFNNQSNTSYPSTSLFAINLPINTPTGSNRLLIMLGNPYSIQNGKLWIGNNLATPFQSSMVIGDNICHHIAYSQNGGIGSIYIDGVAVGAFNDSIVLASTDLYSLGQEWDGNSTSQYFNGEMDELRIWNFARSQAEILADINVTLTGNEPNLVAYYNFDQGTPGGNNLGITNLIDFTNSGYNGTLNNFTLSGSISNWISDTCQAINTSYNIATAKEIGISIYPNPTSNQLHIACKQSIQEIKIIDITGRTVINTKNNIRNINVSELPKGIYCLVLTVNDTVICRKFIKQ